MAKVICIRTRQEILDYPVNLEQGEELIKVLRLHSLSVAGYSLPLKYLIWSLIREVESNSGANSLATSKREVKP